MANKPLRMQKIRQILLFLDRGYSQRSIEKETGVNRRTIAVYLQRFKESGYTPSELLKRDDIALKELLEKSKPQVATAPLDPRHAILESLYPHFEKELQRVGVTRYLLWQEYIVEHPTGFGYSRFCELLQNYTKKNGATMHFEHEPGTELQVDFAGDPLYYYDQSSGEAIKCPVFVAVLPFSGYTFVEALPNASLPQVLRALNNTLSYFGGVPKRVKSDNMKQWVRRTSRYEPVFTDLLEQWASYNRIALLATRPAKPRDKASVESAVRTTYLKIYAPLRNKKFYSLNALNHAICQELEKHHKQNYQRKTFSRSECFKDREQPQLSPLPEKPFVAKHYTQGKVQKNYHVVVGEDWHYYSVPVRYIGTRVQIIYCTEYVEIYHQGVRIALHKRNYRKHGYTTSPEHEPEHHKYIRESNLWNPDSYLKQAQKHGPFTYNYFQKVMENSTVIDQSYLACRGLLRLAASYPDRIEGACKRGLLGHRYNYTIIKNILKNRMDLLEQSSPGQDTYKIKTHENIRGAQEYN